MAQSFRGPSKTSGAGAEGETRAGRIFSWLSGIVCFLFLFTVFGLIVNQIFIHPPPPQRITLVRDVPLPDGLGVASPGKTDPLAPGPTEQFDHFDFQAIDTRPEEHKLFLVHSGPNPDKLTALKIPFDAATDGHILVYDLKQQKLVGRVPIPSSAGIVLAPDLHKVFVADAGDNRIYSFNEDGPFNQSPVANIPCAQLPANSSIQCAQLNDNDGPDALTYDPVEHRVFVSDPGSAPSLTSTDPTQSEINRDNQNVGVIDALTTKVMSRINIGHLPWPYKNGISSDPKDDPYLDPNTVPHFGYDIGHVRYDPGTHLVYGVTEVLVRALDPNAPSVPPVGSATLITINPVTNTIVNRTQLPNSCSTPHGMNIDQNQGIAYIACIGVAGVPDVAVPTFQHLLRMNVKTLQTKHTIEAFPDDPNLLHLAPAPDIVQIDYALHLVMVGCNGGISVFDETPGQPLRKLGDYSVGKGTHSIVIDETTQYIYAPVASKGNWPTLVVAQYNPQGV